jgi:hypothetical protein
MSADNELDELDSLLVDVEDQTRHSMQLLKQKVTGLFLSKF